MTVFVLVQILLVAGAFFVGTNFGDPNDDLEYESSGAPANCRALIYENYKRYVLEETYDLSAEEALTSINRNCGQRGHLWGN